MRGRDCHQLRSLKAVGPDLRHALIDVLRRDDDDIVIPSRAMFELGLAVVEGLAQDRHDSVDVVLRVLVGSDDSFATMRMSSSARFVLRFAARTSVGA